MQRYSLENTARFISPNHQIYPSRQFSYSFLKSNNSFNNADKGQKIINFVGDMQKNIEQTLQNLHCCKSCLREFRQVMTIFGQKLQKLRNQRDILRQKYINDIYDKQNKIKQLQQQNNIIKQKLICFLVETEKQSDEVQKYHKYLAGSSQFQVPRYISFDISQQSNEQASYNENYNQNQQEDLQSYHQMLDNEQKKYRHRRHTSQINQQRGNQYNNSVQLQTLNQKHQKIKKMAIKYNLSNNQLQKMIQQYLNVQEQLSPDSDQIAKLLSLQNQLRKEREKKQIGNQLNQYVKRSNSDKHKNRSGFLSVLKQN